MWQALRGLLRRLGGQRELIDCPLCAGRLDKRHPSGSVEPEATGQPLGELPGRPACIGLDLLDQVERAADPLRELRLGQVERFASPLQPVAERVGAFH